MVLEAMTRAGAVARTREAIAGYVERAKMSLAPLGGAAGPDDPERTGRRDSALRQGEDRCSETQWKSPSSPESRSCSSAEARSRTSRAASVPRRKSSRSGRPRPTPRPSSIRAEARARAEAARLEAAGRFDAGGAVGRRPIPATDPRQRHNPRRHRSCRGNFRPAGALVLAERRPESRRPRRSGMGSKGDALHRASPRAARPAARLHRHHRGLGARPVLAVAVRHQMDEGRSTSQDDRAPRVRADRRRSSPSSSSRSTAPSYSVCRSALPGLDVRRACDQPADAQGGVRVRRAAVLLAAVGILFCHFFIIHRVIWALVAITGEVAESTFGIEPTMNLVLLTFLAFALVFQTPMIMVALARIGLVNVRMLRNYRQLHRDWHPPCSADCSRPTRRRSRCCSSPCRCTRSSRAEHLDHRGARKVLAPRERGALAWRA